MKIQLGWALVLWLSVIERDYIFVYRQSLLPLLVDSQIIPMLQLKRNALSSNGVHGTSGLEYSMKVLTYPSLLPLPPAIHL